MKTIEKINKIAKVQAEKLYWWVPEFQRCVCIQSFAEGFLKAVEIFGKMPFDKAFEMIAEYQVEKKKVREEQLKMIDAYNLSMMPEEEYIRQLRENGADIDEYMRLHHPEKTKGHGNRTTD